MEYNTNELSKILDVSTNTIRRYEKQGFLSSIRDDSNGYRKFSASDVEKLMYVNKYRKIGFSLEEIQEIFDEDISSLRDRFKSKMLEIDDQISKLQAYRHLLKDDEALLGRIEEFGDDMIEMIRPSIDIILYQKDGKLNLGKEHSDAIHSFIEKCPEYEYAYIFPMESVEKKEINYYECVMANSKIIDSNNIKPEPPIKHFNKQLCIMKFVKVPMDLSNESLMPTDELKRILFTQFKEYMKENNYRQGGDMMAIKLCITRENNAEWQHLLIHYPIEHKKGVRYI